MTAPFLHCALTMLVICPATTSATEQSGGKLDPKLHPTHYAHQSWRVREGLPQSSVNALAQTPDGYLWVGTQEGLSRFDGTKFHTYNKSNSPAMRSNHIRRLFCGADSSLWILTSATGIIRMKNGTFLNSPEGLQEHYVTAVAQDERGSIWCGTEQGNILCLSGDSVTLIPWNGKKRAPILTLLPAGHDSLLVGTLPEVRLLTGGELRPFPLAGTMDAGIRTFAYDKKGALWIGTLSGGVWKVTAQGTQRFGATQGLPRARVECLLVDDGGSVWVGMIGGGVARIRGESVSLFGVEDELTSDEVLALFQDREGSLWIGTSAGGLDRLSNGRFVSFTTGRQPSQRTVFAVYQRPGGQILAGNSAGEVLKFDGASFKPLVRLSPDGRALISAFFEDRRGVLWVGAREGLARYQGGKVESVAGTKNGPRGTVLAIVEDIHGDLLISMTYGLWRYRRGSFEQVHIPDSVRPPALRSLHVNDDGSLWGVAWGTGLWWIGDRGVRRYTVDDGLPTNDLMSLKRDRDGTLWIGTIGYGIVRFKNGVFTRFTGYRGLSDDNIYTILEDDSGRLWMSSNNGVFSASKADLNAYADGHPIVIGCSYYGEDDGIKSRECNGLGLNSGLRSNDGRLWFTSVMGVAMVDPDHMPYNDAPPPIVIEEAMIDHRDYSPHFRIEAPPGVGQMEFRYAGLSLVNPSKVLFRYRLEGFDDEWVEAGTRRAAYYTNIPPGDYLFRVTASNNDGVWNPTGAALAVHLAPQFYQTVWFAVLCALAVAAGGYRGFLLYKRNHERKLQSSQLETMLTRARLQALTMQLQPHFLFNTLHAIVVLVRESPELAARMITGLSELLRMTLEDSNQEVVPLARELEFLYKYLEIQQIRFQDRLKIVVDVEEDVLGAMVPTLILQPLVENAITHGIAKRSGPGSIEIRGRQNADSLELEVADNGGGVHPSGRDTAHNGLGIANTKARLRHLFGENHRFDLTGSPQHGTRVKMMLPLRFESEGVTSVTEVDDVTTQAS